MQTLRLLPSPQPMTLATLLSSLGYPAYTVPPEIMKEAGYTHLATFSCGEDHQDADTIATAVEKAILSVFPDQVKLTANDPAQELTLWRHPNPPPVSAEAFPGPLDVAHSLRVLQAVGIARANALAAQRDRAVLFKAAESEIARLTDLLNAEQALFEHMVEILEGRRPCP